MYYYYLVEVMENFVIKVGLCGCVSVGKSTFLNAIAGKQLSDTEMKATTFVPQIYTEKQINCNTPEIIRLKNRKMNQIAEEQIEKGQFDIKQCVPVVHQINRLCDLVNEDSENIKLEFHDIPGLNDSSGKSIYFEYARKNIKNYDIIIFMTDINRGLSNSDEVDVLNLLIESMTQTRSRMICLINKCDDIYFDIDENDLMFEENEQENIYISANNTLADIAKKYNLEVGETKRITPFLPISAENCYIYRALHENPDYKLDPIHKARLCKNECGNFTWKKMTQDEKDKVFDKIIKDLQSDYARKILDTGYVGVRYIIQNTISNNKSEFIRGRINEQINHLMLNSIINLDDYFLLVSSIYDKMKKIQSYLEKEDICNFWKHIQVTIDNHVNLLFKMNIPVVRQNGSLNLENLDKVNTLIQSACIGLENFANKMAEYILYDTHNLEYKFPATFFETRTRMIASKLLLTFENLKNINHDDHQYLTLNDIRMFLQFIKKYAPERFDEHAFSFMKFRLFEPDSKYFCKKYDELISFFNFVGENTESKDKFIAHICLVIIKKYKTRIDLFSHVYLDYLIRLKTMISPYVNDYPISILTEILDDDIRKQPEFIKLKILNGIVDTNKPNIDMKFEQDLLNCITTKYVN